MTNNNQQLLQEAQEAGDKFEQEFEKEFVAFLSTHPQFKGFLMHAAIKPIVKSFYYKGAMSSAMQEFVEGK